MDLKQKTVFTAQQGQAEANLQDRVLAGSKKGKMSGLFELAAVDSIRGIELVPMVALFGSGRTGSGGAIAEGNIAGFNRVQYSGQKMDWFLTAAKYLWVGLWIFWLVSAVEVKRAVRRQSFTSRIIQGLPVAAAYYLLFARSASLWPWLSLHFLPGSPGTATFGLLLTAVGIAFSVWARIFIGRNWSATVTVKEEHELIQGGPYAYVRHPIYSGFLLAFLGTAMIEGEARGFAGLVLAAAGWWMKLRTEESFMLQQFGPVYADYRKRVKALVPFVV